jgi:hypothetical protein
VSHPNRQLETPWFSTRSYAHLLLSGGVERFPRLRYIVTESGCAWVPGTLENLDRIWARVRTGAVGEFEFAKGCLPPEPPSVYAKRNCYYGASAPSRRELAGREEIGVDHLLWGSDYPHYEGTYPHTRASFRHTLHDVAPQEVRAILANAARLYGSISTHSPPSQRAAGRRRPRSPSRSRPRSCRGTRTATPSADAPSRSPREALLVPGRTEPHQGAPLPRREGDRARAGAREPRARRAAPARAPGEEPARQAPGPRARRRELRERVARHPRVPGGAPPRAGDARAHAARARARPGDRAHRRPRRARRGGAR